MDSNEFVTRADINPLFEIRELKETSADIVRAISEQSPKQADLDLAVRKIRFVHVVLEYLMEYLRELGAVSEDLSRTFDEALASLKTDDVKDESLKTKEKHQDGVLSQDERAKLQQHIPGFKTGEDTSAEHPEIQKLIMDMKSQIQILQKQLKALIQESYHDTSQAPETENSERTEEQKTRKRGSERTKTSEEQDKQEKPKKKKAANRRSEGRQVVRTTKNEADDHKSKQADEKKRKTQNALSASSEKISLLNQDQTKQADITSVDLPSEGQEDANEPAIDAVAEINQQQHTDSVPTAWQQIEAVTKRRIQHATKLMEEREKRRLVHEEEQRQYERRRNPDNWPTLRYTVSCDASLVTTDLGCAVKVPEGTNTKRLECTTADVVVDGGPQELLASNVIRLATKDQEPMRFEFPALISLPYKPLPGLEPTVYTKEGQGHWMAVSTRQHKDGALSMAQFERSTLQHLTFAVKMSASRHYKVTDKASMISDPEDSSVRIKVPERTFKHEGEIRLKVVDQHSMSETKSRLSDSDMVENLSALYNVHVTGARNGSIYLEIGFNSNTSALPVILPPGHRVHLMTSPDGVRWTRKEPVRTDDGRRFSHELRWDEAGTWLLLVHTKGFCDPSETLKVSREIMKRLTELPLYILLYQHKENTASIQLQTCTPGTLQKVLSQLEDNSYPEGTIQLVHVPDGSYLHIRPSAEGNIEFSEDVKCPIILKHMTCLDAGELTTPVQIKVKNKYIQKNHKVYGGKIQVFNITSRIARNGSGTEQSKRFLCELPMSLPKESMKIEETSRMQTRRTFMGSEPLTADYVRELIAELGERWTDVVLRLGVSSTTIQKILSKWQDSEDAKFELFTIWYMRSNKNALKVSQLIRVLHDIDRQDLEDELRKKYDVIMEDKRYKNKESLLSLLARRVATDPGALDDWKNILRALSVDEATIANIEEEKKPVNRIYCLQRGLLHWLHLGNKTSNPQDVYVTLKQLGHLAAAAQVSRWLGMKNA